MARQWLLFGCVCAALAGASCLMDFDEFEPNNKLIAGASTSTTSTSSGMGGEGGLFTSTTTGGGSTTTSTTAAGGTGGDGGTAGAGGSGGCIDPVECNDPGDCVEPTCSNNMCGVADEAEGTVCTSNGGNICDGAGMCIACAADPPTAPGGSCDNSVCTGGCNAQNECLVDCSGDGSNCPSFPVTCPAGFNCVIDCEDNNCSNYMFTCPANEACTLNCDGKTGNTSACAGVTLNCSNEACELNCTNEGCSMTIVACGTGKCAANCDAGSSGTLTCGGSCWCAANGGCTSM